MPNVDMYMSIFRRTNHDSTERLQCVFLIIISNNLLHCSLHLAVQSDSDVLGHISSPMGVSCGPANNNLEAQKGQRSWMFTYTLINSLRLNLEALRTLSTHDRWQLIDRTDSWGRELWPTEKEEGGANSPHPVSKENSVYIHQHKKCSSSRNQVTQLIFRLVQATQCQFQLKSGFGWTYSEYKNALLHVKDILFHPPFVSALTEILFLSKVFVLQIYACKKMIGNLLVCCHFVSL